MLKKCVLLLIIFCSSLLGGQNQQVKVNLKDGNIVTGKLLKISSEGIEINPGGSVRFRFISAERIKSVELLDLNKTVEYPLTEADIPTDVRRYEAEIASQEIGFPKFLGLCSLGYTSVGGDYYEGFSSNVGVRLGLYYYLPDSDPMAGRVFFGFSYSHSSIKGDLSSFGLSNVEPKLLLNEYSFEIGLTTRMLEGNYYLYFLTGIAAASNEITMPVSSATISYSETKAAWRVEGGANISIGRRFFIPIAIGYDMIFAKKATSTYNYATNSYDDTAFIGGILNLSIGISYAF